MHATRKGTTGVPKSEKNEAPPEDSRVKLKPKAATTAHRRRIPQPKVKKAAQKVKKNSRSTAGE